MKAYVIVEIYIQDHDLYEEYKKLTPATIAAYDGKFLIRGAKSDSLEGDWNPERVVVLEFTSAERAKQWWHSQEYAKPKAIRQRAATTKMLLVEGLE